MARAGAPPKKQKPQLRLVALGDETLHHYAVTEALRHKEAVIVPWARQDPLWCHFETPNRWYALLRSLQSNARRPLNNRSFSGALLILNPVNGPSVSQDHLALAEQCSLPIVALLVKTKGASEEQMDTLERALRERLSANGLVGDEARVLRAEASDLETSYGEDGTVTGGAQKVSQQIKAWRDTWLPVLAPLLQALDEHLSERQSLL